jgi:hypothetical protein
MPIPVDSITEKTGIHDIRKAIGDSIRTLIKEGKSQKQAAAIAYDIAEKKSGRKIE